MSQNPTETLFTHFAYYLGESQFGPNEWHLINSEFGVHDIASSTHRFYRSWEWGDQDRIPNTIKFLRKVHNEKPDTAFGIMKRAYSMTTGATDDQIQKYPAIQALVNEDLDIPEILPEIPTHSENFLEIENVFGQFYPELISNINRCYRIGVYDATFVLTRKLLENLLIDIFRNRFGTSRIELYYDPNNSQFRGFSSLVENFENNIDDFRHLSGGLNDDFIDALNEFRRTANAEAHSIEVNLTEDEILEYRDNAEYCVRLLFRIYDNI